MTEVSTYESKMADLESEQLDSQEREVCEQMQVLQRKLEMIRAEKARLRGNHHNSSSPPQECPAKSQAIPKKTTAPVNKGKRNSIFSSLNPFKSAAKKNGNQDQDSVASTTSSSTRKNGQEERVRGTSPPRHNYHKSPEHMIVPVNNRRLGGNPAQHGQRQGRHAINRTRRGGVHRSASQQEMRRQSVPIKDCDLQANVVHGNKHEHGKQQGFRSPTSQHNLGPYGDGKRKAQRSHSMTPIRSNQSRQVMDRETESYRPGMIVSHQPRQASKQPRGRTMPKQQQSDQKPTPPPMQMPTNFLDEFKAKAGGGGFDLKKTEDEKQAKSPARSGQKAAPRPKTMPCSLLGELKTKASGGFDLKKTDGEKQAQLPQSGRKPSPMAAPISLLDELKAKTSRGGFDLKKAGKQAQSPQSGRVPAKKVAPVSLLDELKAKTSRGGFDLKKTDKQAQRKSMPVPKAGPVSLLDELKMKTSRGGFDLKKTEVPVKRKTQPSTPGNSLLAQLQANKTFAAKREQDWS